MSARITGYPDHFIVDDDTTTCPCAEHSPAVTARNALELAASASVGSPEYDTWFRLLLDRYRDEVAHELAEEIRAADFGDPYYVGTGQGEAADLIDPKTGPGPRDLVFNCQTIEGLEGDHA
ncbi:hypothetical protein ABT096_29690 [Streptomyces sp. NPDC002561]|uniref:hypothetical protein n=1 Tax=Streptomyces sp. NPDC002561 TaxID=3154418 RepID=UPI0033290B91